MHAKYQIAIFNIAKVIANVKVGANQPTDQPTNRATNRPTNRQGKNNIINITILSTTGIFDFHEKILRTFRCDGLADGRIQNHKSPPVKLSDRPTDRQTNRKTDKVTPI
ncbi:hypothetical protein DPMN_185961 [Dreissena polymorpha]|uniref:Uncharacterized protein n=1 Tax=Dreissena polymorpha TaxID=45954 RepID=A0A9D4I7R5_DREPO|nr:hypothetical protein DPMN_185961 [Dreissena polymorpha]